MYPIHSTKGIILKSIPQGEASQIFFVYTEDFGLIRLKGQSIRRLSSKLRFHICDFAVLSLELVRGREIWRLTAAEKIFIPRRRLDKIASISRLVLRLCDLEEKNLPLFLDLSEGFQLFQKEEIDETALEAVIVLRILARLGYLGVDSLLSFVAEPLKQEILPAARENLSFVVAAINEALKETSL